MRRGKITFLVAIIGFLLVVHTASAITDDQYCKNLGYDGGCYCGSTAADCNYCSGDPCGTGADSDCISYSYTTTGFHAVCCYDYKSKGSSCESGRQCVDSWSCHYTKCDGSGHCSEGWDCTYCDYGCDEATGECITKPPCPYTCMASSECAGYGGTCNPDYYCEFGCCCELAATTTTTAKTTTTTTKTTTTTTKTTTTTRKTTTTTTLACSSYDDPTECERNGCEWCPKNNRCYSWIR